MNSYWNSAEKGDTRAEIPNLGERSAFERETVKELFDRIARRDQRSGGDRRNHDDHDDSENRQRSAEKHRQNTGRLARCATARGSPVGIGAKVMKREGLDVALSFRESTRFVHRVRNNSRAAA